MSRIRPPAVAGSFYPASATELAAEVDRLLGPLRDDPDRPRAIVVPHAAYPCSGSVAASAYRTIGRTEPIRRVVVLGPAHYTDPDGIAFPEATAWTTPLGEVSVDHELASALERAGMAHGDDKPHVRDHAIEVQLPWLQRLLGEGWTILPLAVHGTPADAVADCLDLVVDEDVLVVCSTDLSHYFDERTAQRLDRRTAEAVVDRDAAAIGSEQACGVYPLRGTVAWARRHELSVELLDLRTSAETCSSPDQVVGYGAFTVTSGGGS